MQESSQKLLVVLALGALYFIWGSTYIAMRFAMDSFPPFMMAALRFSIAGGLLYAFLRLRGTPAPRRQEWLGASVVGVLLLTIGNAGVAYAEQTVSSGVAALSIATVPLWMAMFSGLWQQWPNQREWLGILLGTVGVVVLNMGGALQASPLGAGLLLFSAACWAFGSLWGKYLIMPAGAMASAAQMLAGGAVLILISMASGESWPAQPTEKSHLCDGLPDCFWFFSGLQRLSFLAENCASCACQQQRFCKSYSRPVVRCVAGSRGNWTR
jgi:drug/metabolite transporter (DMT)-like permease